MLQFKGHFLILYTDCHLGRVNDSSCVAQSTIQVQLIQSQGCNTIILRCQNNSNFKPKEDTFFLNSSELSPANYPAFRNQENQPGVVTFQIKRQLEGMYSCGVEEMKSSPISLISKYMTVAYLGFHEGGCLKFYNHAHYWVCNIYY